MIIDSKEHKERFIELMRKYNKFNPNYSNGMEPCCGAAYYILTSDGDFISRIGDKYFGNSFDNEYMNGYIKFSEIFNNVGFSSTQDFLLRYAANFFDSLNYESPNMGNMISILSEEQFQVLYKAMLIRRDEIKIDQI